VQGVVAELLADRVDGHAAPVTAVEGRERQLRLVESELREGNTEKANWQGARSSATIEVEGDAVDLDIEWVDQPEPRGTAHETWQRARGWSSED